MPPFGKKYVSTQDLVDGGRKQFGYQLQLAGEEVEANIDTPEKIRQFLNGMYGGKTASGQQFFRPETGLNLPLLKDMGNSPLLDGTVSMLLFRFSRLAHTT